MKIGITNLNYLTALTNERKKVTSKTESEEKVTKKALDILEQIQKKRFVLVHGPRYKRGQGPGRKFVNKPHPKPPAPPKKKPVKRNIFIQP